ncbi:MAG: hypothetical protein FWD77_01940 [Betaproteobacteria bacterium]|nr:hypothetical protein [Betaproteobacteria bacterium]
MTNIHDLSRALALFLFCAGIACAQENAPEQPLVDFSLDQIGARIKRPANWHYKETRMETSYSWTFSLEDGSDETYTTGVHVQAFPSIQKKTGEGGEGFAYSFIEQKRKVATKVLKVCPDWKDGSYTRSCLETEEGPKHYLYSLAWEKNKDVVVISIASTEKELWPRYESVFETMAKFEFSDK